MPSYLQNIARRATGRPPADVPALLPARPLFRNVAGIPELPTRVVERPATRSASPRQSSRPDPTRSVTQVDAVDAETGSPATAPSEGARDLERLGPVASRQVNPDRSEESSIPTQRPIPHRPMAAVDGEVPQAEIGRRPISAASEQRRGEPDSSPLRPPHPDSRLAPAQAAEEAGQRKVDLGPVRTAERGATPVGKAPPEVPAVLPMFASPQRNQPDREPERVPLPRLEPGARAGRDAVREVNIGSIEVHVAPPPAPMAAPAPPPVAAKAPGAVRLSRPARSFGWIQS